MSRSSPWPTSWRGSPGRCCSAGNRLTPKRYPWPRRGSLGRSESAGRASGVCERVKTRWPDSQTALRKPGVENGARRRRVYEDRGARISILAGRRPPRPDTLKQTDQPPNLDKTPCRRGGPYVSTSVMGGTPPRRPIRSARMWKRRPQSWSRPARRSTYSPRVGQGKQHRSRTGSRSAPWPILSLGSGGAPPRAPPLRRSVVRIPSAPPSSPHKTAVVSGFEEIGALDRL